ncbi:hypothetical protein RUM44_000448 [Polyplax serrata]|uniref:WD repeat-containing protein 11 n=1 Tax=Polyplax serrata TaxID=468196 RepID=A0ABR1B5F7_POLSC
MLKEIEPDAAVATTPIDSEASLQKGTVVVHVPRVTPRTLPGLANVQNKGAIDWGGHGLLAYGSNYTVVIVDTRNVQLVQCLDKHKAMVKKVLWGNDYLRQDRSTEYPPCRYGSIDLVSSDATGHIIVWDVTLGQQVNILQEGSKPVADMSWVTQWDGYSHILAALHPPCCLVLWDTRKGTKLWKKTYTESLIAFNFDPFHPTKMAFHCTDCILFVEDFRITTAPPSNGRKFYVSSPRATASGARGSTSNLSNKGSSGNLAAAIQEEKTGAKDRFRRLMKDLVIGEVQPKTDDTMTLSECLQVAYHKSIRHLILLLYSRELLILDLHIKQTVGVIPTMEKAASPFLQVYSCKQRDILYCLHESGSVTVKMKRKTGGACSPTDALSRTPSIASLETSTDTQLEVGYDHRCSSEPVRQIRGLQILGISVNPVTETRIALYLNSGKIVFLELLPVNTSESNYNFAMNFVSSPLSKGPVRKFSLNEILPPLMNDVTIQPPGLRLLVMGVLPNVAAPITALKMCPAITTRNWHQYTPLLAGGTTGGLVQIFNIASGCIEKELIVHSYTVRGIEWTGVKTFLSYAYPSASSTSANVRNELYLTDVLTGESVALRTDKGDEPPIEILKVSPLKQYFILVISGGQFELWDLKSRQLVRTMRKKFPVVTAVEWLPQSGSRSFKRRQSSKEECVLDVKKTTGPGMSTIGGPLSTVVTPLTPVTITKSILDKPETAEKINSKEQFVCVDVDNQLYQFTIDGHAMDGFRMSPESGNGTVTTLAFKADHLVQGDADGLLSIWDMRSGQTRRYPTSRSCIKKLRFAPGKGNMKLLVLYQDGVDVIDLKGVISSAGPSGFEKIGQLKCPRDMVKVLDIDWAASDKPILYTQDGCLRIMDMDLLKSSSPLTDYVFQDPVFCPALLPSEVAYKVRERLCWQPADIPYTTDLTLEHGFTENQVALINAQLGMVDEDRLECLKKPRFKTAERCLVVAQLFGDEREIDLWTVALYYLQISKAKASAVGDSASIKSEESLPSPVALDCKKFNNYANIIPLDTCYDILQDCYTYQRLQLERVALHESRRTDHEHTKRVIQQQLLLGQSDRAVQLLLETDVDNSDYYADSIKACLIATVQSSEVSQSTIKLVATNLIAHGKIWEGVQLLCLIGKGLDACRYLTSYSRWGAAAWLARAVLRPSEAVEVIRKWADHLSSQGYKEKAVLVLISLEQWHSAHSLLSVVDPRRASLLAQACREFDVKFTS